MPKTNIALPSGFPPLSTFTDAELLRAFLVFGRAGGGVAGLDLVQLLSYAFNVESDGERKAGAILRKCLTAGGYLVAVYPASGDFPPVGAKCLGSIMDGSLWLVAPANYTGLENKTIFDLTDNVQLLEQITGFSPLDKEKVDFYCRCCHPVNKLSDIASLAVCLGDKKLESNANKLQRKFWKDFNRRAAVAAKSGLLIEP